MASANLDLVRWIYADWGRGDYSSADWADPEIEYVLADGPAPGSWTGLAEMAAAWRDILNSWDRFTIEVDAYRELDDGRILVVNHVSGRGKTSGLDVGQVRARAASVFELRDGKVVRLVQYWDAERALADLGLPPETD